MGQPVEPIDCGRRSRNSANRRRNVGLREKAAKLRFVKEAGGGEENEAKAAGFAAAQGTGTVRTRSASFSFGEILCQENAQIATVWQSY